MSEVIRAALFADTFHEINGAANVLRRLTDYAKEKNHPFLCIRTGPKTKFWEEGSLQILELKRGPVSIPLDSELKYDPFLWRQTALIRRTLEKFQPEVCHMTGINDVSLIGFYLAHSMRLRGIASWHTNGHEYAARRLLRMLPFLPAKAQVKLGRLVENSVMRGFMKIYYLAHVQLAPNEELVRQIRKMTRRPSYLMSRGVDTEFLNPSKRNRSDDLFTIGYVGRLRAEKNVRFLSEVQNALQKAGLTNYKFLIVGDGNEQSWLEANLKNAEFTGPLRGEPLARAFANMDLFVFPSKTDAFGNVVLEGMAAGVPSVVMPDNGPKFLIEHEKTGFIAHDDQNFCETVVKIVREKEKLPTIRLAAREAALEYSWERVFDKVFENYYIAKTLRKNARVDENNVFINNLENQNS